MNVSKLKVPAKFDCNDFADKLYELNQKYCHNGIVADETYGCVPSSYVGNARAAKDLYPISLDQLANYINKTSKKGIGFNYVMNAVWSQGEEFSEQGQEHIINEVKQLIDCGVSSVTISSPGIIRIVKKQFPSLNITISINTCVSSLHEIFRWEKVGISKIVLNRHINRDVNLLHSMVKSTSTKLELLLNSMCNLHCSLHQYHNLINGVNSNVSAEGIETKYPQSQCSLNCIKNPCEMICSAWIRPEDLGIYENIGLSSFKLDGRCLNANDIIFILERYLQRYHEGNFFDLFDFMNTRQEAGVKYYLNNRILDGFAKSLIEKNIDCRVCGGRNETCNKLAEKIEILNQKEAKIFSKMLSAAINQ